MSWNQWYRATSYVKPVLWVAPCAAMLFEQVAIRLLHFLDARLGLDAAEPRRRRTANLA